MKYLFAIDKNRGCQLPCWWGIEPLKAQLETVFKVIQPFGLKKIAIPFVAREGWYGFYLNDSYVGAISLEAFFENDVLNGIYLNFSVDRATNDGIGIQRSRFSLPKMLQTFGKPDEVLVELQLGTADPGGINCNIHFG